MPALPDIPLWIGLCAPCFLAGLILGLLARHCTLKVWTVWDHWRRHQYVKRELKKAGFVKMKVPRQRKGE